jgi:hypothetical protein
MKNETNCIKCGRANTPGKMLLLLWIDQQKGNHGKDETAKIIGVIHPRVCNFCLARYTFKRFGGATLQFLFGTLIVVMITWLIGFVINLGWIGALFILGLLINLFKEYRQIFRTAQLLGPGRLAWDGYLKNKAIPGEDFVLRTADVVPVTGSFPLIPTSTFNLDDLVLVDESQINSFKESEPDRYEEFTQIFASANANTQTSDPAKSRTSLGSAMGYYVTSFSILIMTVFYLVLFLANVLDGGSETLLGIVGAVFGAIGVFGAVQLLKTKWKGILPILAAWVVMILLFAMNGEYGRDETALIFTVAVSLPILVIVPQLKKTINENIKDIV